MISTIFRYGCFSSITVFNYLKTYVPKDTVECSDGVSVYVKEIDCELGKLIIKNNGRFSVAGFLIKGTTDENQKIATKNLCSENGEMVFTGSELADPPVNALGVNMQNYNPQGDGDLNQSINCDFNGIYSVEITPFRYDLYDGKPKKVICGKSKIRELIPGGLCERSPSQ